MKEIKLTHGLVAIVDDEDFEFLSQWSWCVLKKTKTYYARRVFQRNTVYMHREICNCPDGYVVDHINRNGLDNRRSNLRVVTHGQNAINAGLWQTNTSGFRGVFYSTSKRKWIAKTSIKTNGREKYVHIGRFDSPEEGYAAYLAKVIEIHGNVLPE